MLRKQQAQIDQQKHEQYHSRVAGRHRAPIDLVLRQEP